MMLLHTGVKPHMRAATFHSYGPPQALSIQEVPDPTPKQGEIRIRVHASTVSAADSRLRALRVDSKVFWLPIRIIMGFRKPRKKRQILGTELAGVIDQVGPAVTQWSVGDEVMASTGLRLGANADYAIMKHDAIVVRKPKNLSFEQAASIPFGALGSMFFLYKKAHLQPGQHVLIVGASGALGCAAIQLAKLRGAHVTAVCSAKNAELVTQLGADRVIDYITHHPLDPSTLLDKIPYDIIYDTVGAAPFGAARRVLAKDGKHLAAVADARGMLWQLRTMLIGSQRAIGGVDSETQESLDEIRALIEDDRYKPVIDRILPLEQIVEGHEIADSGRKVGSLVLSHPIEPSRP